MKGYMKRTKTAQDVLRVSGTVIGRLPPTTPITDFVSCWQRFPLGALLPTTNAPIESVARCSGAVERSHLRIRESCLPTIRRTTLVAGPSEW
jgi:hypothetical protein